MLSDCCTQFFICFFDLHTRENEGDDGIQSKRNHQIHDLQHRDAGFGLDSQRTIEMACCQQPAGDGGAKAAANFAQLTDWLYDMAQPGDLILTVGAGDIYTVGEALVQRDRENQTNA